jgi:hypothetical protein
MGLTIAILILAAGVVPVLLWARYRWKKLKPELFSEAELKQKVTGNATLRVRSNKVGPETVVRLLGRAEALLEEENTPETKAAANAIRQIAAASQQTAPAIDSIIQESLDKVELTSLLLGDDGTYTYIVVAPNRHDHAHLIGRYQAFSAGWRHHAELVRSSLMASGAFRGLTALLFFLSPEGKESIARLAFAGPNSMLIPGALAHGEDLVAADVKVLEASFEFSLTA